MGGGGKEKVMADKKEFKAKGFLLYTDDEDFFRDLDDEEAGVLIKALFRYFNRGEMPTDMPKVVKMGFNVIKKEIDRDTTGYAEKVRKQSEKRSEWWANQKEIVSNYNSLQSIKQTKTKTQTEAEAQTRAEAEAKTKTIKAEADASLVGGSASPPPMEEIYGKSEGNSVFHSAIDKMFDERSKDD